MLTRDIPLVHDDANMGEVLTVMDRASLGLAIAIKPDRTLAGVITDGDVRRLLAKRQPVFELSAKAVMTSRPRTVRPDIPAYDALNLMESYNFV